MACISLQENMRFTGYSIGKGLTFERMYKLLLVTHNQKVKDAFAGVSSWTLLGFKEPRIATSPDEAVATMAKHHVDGMIISLPEQEKRRMIEIMNDHPLIPMILENDQVTVDQVTVDVESIGSILNKTRADYSNDRYSEAEMMQMCRHEYFRKLLSGKEKNKADILRNLLLLRSKMDPEVPCVLMELSVPEDGYLAGKWQDGANRLEVVMRNIFGAEKEGMRVLVSVVDEERLFLTACPMIGEKQPGSVQHMLEIVHDHAQAGIEHVREFLGMDLRIASEEIRPDLLSLADQGV